MSKEFIQPMPVGSLTQRQDLGRLSAERAQEQWDNAVHLAQLEGKPVKLTVEHGTESYIIGQDTDAKKIPGTQPILSKGAKGTIFENPTSLDKANNRKGNGIDSPPKEQKQKRPTKTHDTRGLNGFYKGTFYSGGVAQSNNKRGK